MEGGRGGGKGAKWTSEGTEGGDVGLVRNVYIIKILLSSLSASVRVSERRLSTHAVNGEHSPGERSQNPTAPAARRADTDRRAL